MFSDLVHLDNAASMASIEQSGVFDAVWLLESMGCCCVGKAREKGVKTQETADQEFFFRPRVSKKKDIRLGYERTPSRKMTGTLDETTVLSHPPQSVPQSEAQSQSVDAEIPIREPPKASEIPAVVSHIDEAPKEIARAEEERSPVPDEETLFRRAERLKQETEGVLERLECVEDASSDNIIQALQQMHDSIETASGIGHVLDAHAQLSGMLDQPDAGEGMEATDNELASILKECTTVLRELVGCSAE